ncbi:mitogen-activated protein kinase kinase kinase 1-like [Diadema antillarum]|uniref:mitogen-activated protein kinase kinase kinase 1-like n=1 Tax=Diadema antillarum TaxID=105358 RepID=UPI003A893B33
MEKATEKQSKSRLKHGESGSCDGNVDGSSAGTSSSGAVRKHHHHSSSGRKRSGDRSRSRTRRRSGSGSRNDKNIPSTDSSAPPNLKSKEDSSAPINIKSSPSAADLGTSSGEPSPRQNGSTDREMRRMSKLDDPLEKQAIREKLRAKPGIRKEGGDAARTKGPMVARPPSSPTPTDGTSSASSTPPPTGASSSSSTPGTVRRPRSLLPQRSQSPSAQASRESPFAKQVVNRVASPTSPGLLRHRGYVSPSGSRPSSPTGSHRRAASPNNESLFTLAVGVLKKRVERALHARLFLLSQIGPNSFLIGGDSPDHKYKVTIGSQNCNCGKGPFCVHLLFVMLRVFKLPEDDNLLWNRTLKNYEVELLFSKYEAMKKKKLKQSPGTHSSQRSQRSSQSPSTSHIPRPSSPCPSTGSSDQREDEDLCPICLLDMVEGESLVVCKNGCHNKLHHHCVAIWAEECKRQEEPMVCPLCRAVWLAGTTDSHGDSTEAPEGAGVASSAVQEGEEGRGEGGGGTETNRLETFQQKKERWKEAFEENGLVQSMFSRDWGLRENALHSLNQILSAKLKRADSQVRDPHGAEVCEERFQAELLTMEAGFDMVAMACSDPVYKVYVAALRALRTLLMCVHCSSEDQQAQLRVWLQPVMAAILVKCADGNRRTAQLSVSAMLELARGDAGELAISKELSCSGCIGIGGLDYVLSCLISDIQITLDDSSWQRILGRLNVLERVFTDFPDRFVLSDSASELEMESKVECLVSIATCLSSYLNNQHIRICKIAKRVFITVAKILVSNSAAFAKICDMMRMLESTEVGTRMLRRLRKILEEYESSMEEAERDLEESCASGRERTKEDREDNVQERDEKDGRRSGVLYHLRNPSPEACGAECGDLPGEDGARSQPQTPRGRTPSTEDEQRGNCSTHCTNVSDLSDLTASPTTPLDNPITFKSEVAQTPKNSSPFNFQLPGFGSKKCKDAVEAEEAEALAVAMEASMHSQGVLPQVPGLQTNKGEIIVRIQHQEGGDTVDSITKQYRENQEWVKGALLGTGAFSTCYMARDVSTGTLMAVKQISFYRNSADEQDKTLEDICKEIKLMGTFDHPHIVRLMGATQYDGHFNVFVEWMPGGSVSMLLRSYGAFSSVVTTRYIHQVCLGLAYLHDNRVIHRDLKGANLLLDSTGHHLRIADLGTAAKMNAEITRTDEFKGQFLGTIAFMAPEVLRGEQYGRSCDVWSLGCCIIEMCTTKPPWNASEISNHLQLLFKIASANGPPPMPETLDPALRDIALRCLESTPSARPSAVELLKHSAFRQMKEF